MKICYKCKESKDYVQFHKDSRSKDGFQYKCKDCKKEWSKLRYENKKEHITKVNKKWQDNNKDKVREISKKWARENTDKTKERFDKWYNINKDVKLERNRKWKKDNPAANLFYMAKYRASKLQATPQWSEEDKIRTLYKKVKWLESITGIKYHVDHIIPLQGKNVCGLHIWNNLQILEASLNISKGNRIK